MIKRIIEDQIVSLLGSGKAIIIMGARQVGKSTLLDTIFHDKKDILWMTGDDLDVQELFSQMTSTRLKALLGATKILIIDEAQRIPEIGLRLKLITDQIKDVQVVATGSSSFELASKVNESLAGRKREFRMYPISFSEMVSHTNLLEELRLIPHRMIYGYYPEVVSNPGNEAVILKELSDSFLYKDILSFESINKPDKIVRLLKALAFQIGNQVSYNEVGQLVGLDSKTVQRYIDILEKSYIIFRLGSWNKLSAGSILMCLRRTKVITLLFAPCTRFPFLPRTRCDSVRIFRAFWAFMSRILLNRLRKMWQDHTTLFIKQKTGESCILISAERSIVIHQ